jgi:IstB-like ATP binding protein
MLRCLFERADRAFNPASAHCTQCDCERPVRECWAGAPSARRRAVGSLCASRSACRLLCRVAFAQAAIGAAARELRLPTIRAEADRLAEIATREHQSYLVFLAELLAAEVDDRAERRRTRRITEAKFPRIKRISEFNVASPSTPISLRPAPTPTGSAVQNALPAVSGQANPS